jgi:prepilin signal peptidase PulO-like enzyme (type II secretory pathway)
LVQPVQLILFFVLGLIAGVIVNQLADVLPDNKRPTLPRYRDGSPRPITAWLSVVAFLTGQRASPGGAKLPWRYPLTEIGTGLLFVLTYLATYDDPYMNTVQLVFWLIYMVIFSLVTVIDLEHKLILFVVMIPAGLLAVLDAVVAGYLPDLRNVLLGGAFGFIVSYLLYLGGFVFIRYLSRARGYPINTVAFGYGDVMLFTFSGLLLGPAALLFAMYITVVCGAIGAIAYLVYRNVAGRGYTMFTALPYGPYIVIGTIIMLLFSAEVMFGIKGAGI